MQFSKISLSGFKSFVDPTELLIEPGTTGIVGPNGCGKSNLVEALRWVMGEISARKLRGEEMDDLIFGGTVNRPARNLAEVALHLDNSDRTAPAAFNDSDELEIIRRIERGEGSNFRINGKDVRARDVQLLFADSATGSRSTALVSQGQIETLIQAKPLARRSILEEAAGITGLYSRRHEAELRLKAAETNLERLEDVIAALESQLQNLKRQARQATRYRNLSDHIRKAEAAVLHLRWTAASAVRADGAARLEAAGTRVNALTREAGIAATRQAEAASALPALRRAEADASAALQRLVLARDALAEEEDRVNRALAAARERLAQNAADRERESARLADAEAAIGRLDGERAALEGALAEEAGAEKEAEAALAAAAAEAEAVEARLAALAERVAGAEARRADLANRVIGIEARKARLQERLAEAEGTRSALAAEPGNRDRVAALEAEIEGARTALEDLRARGATAEEDKTAREGAETEARDRLGAAEAEAAGLRAEARALEDVLAVADDELWPPLIDAVTVEAGYEAALGAALGDDLTAPADEAAPVHWRTLGPLAAPPALPAGAEPLALYVTAPGALGRRLGQIGVVSDADAGSRLAPSLAVGQRLVSRDGRLWRWDGFTVADAAASAAAKRLGQRNRLAEVRSRVQGAEGRLAQARTALEAAAARSREAAERERALRAGARDAEAALEARREERAHLLHESAEANSRLQAAEEAIARLGADIGEAERELAEVRRSQAALADTDEHRARLEALRSELNDIRATLAERQRAYDLLARESAARRQRLADIAEERASWAGRAATARGQVEELEGRRRATEAEIEGLAARPAEIAAERMGLGDRVDAAERARAEAADALALAEAALKEADEALRAREAELAAAREDRVRAEGLLEQAEQTLTTLRERIAERVEAAPDELPAIAGIDPESPPETEAAERRLERLLRERDNMGPVNLRAQQEADELGEQIASMETEREDLTKAISRLRHGINELNREGRARFLAAFEQVNAHFGALFTRLFGGGRAHLELTESDDPLEAGLEIMASPPGKRLQVLSLLSGGEKALTTIALQFAVFLTNPAPICVLDEVDAPLDDSNVNRFCSLVEELARGGDTRFLLVTHHRITMARMDRLFGVTMPERGVSRLVSVDLQGVSHLKAIA
ncbi:MAG TPA: chromosome segregation protein SMC [Alphaproteobacteria bacterium]